MKLIVELIRHGETELQAQGRYQGAVDVPLSGEGRRKLSAGPMGYTGIRLWYMFLLSKGQGKRLQSFFRRQFRL